MRPGRRRIVARWLRCGTINAESARARCGAHCRSLVVSTCFSLVFVAVMFFLFFALFGRKREGDVTNSLHKGSRIVLYGGIIAPAVVLLVVFGFTVATLNTLSMQFWNPKAVNYIG